MKKFLYMAAFVILCCGASLSSCNDDKLGGVSIFKTDAPQKTRCPGTMVISQLYDAL